MRPQEIIIRVVVEQPSATTAPEPEKVDNQEEFVEVKDKEYTPSQRLRFALHRRWQRSKSQEDFKDYYATQIDKIIKMVEK